MTAAAPIVTGAQRPRIAATPQSFSRMAGVEATDLAYSSGLVMDDWQAWTLQQAMGTNLDGRWSAFEVGLLVSRQNGKNAILEARELAGLYLLGEQLIIHTAHEFKAASEHFRRVADLIDGRAELRSRVKAIRTSHGDETIELRPTPALIFGPGGTQVRKSVKPRLRFLARSRGSGRSFTADLVVWDEAMILSEDQVSASLPTLSAVPNPQLWYTASAGWPDSTQLARLRRRGIKAARNPGGADSLVWLEWSLDVGGGQYKEFCEQAPICSDDHVHDDPNDDTTWGKANPGLGIRISPDHVRREYDAMSDGRGHAGIGFLRERLGVGQWPLDDESWSVIPEATWDACIDMDYPRPSRFCFCADSTPDQSAACIVVAGFLRDGRIAVEIPMDEQGVRDHRAGTSWVVGRLKELKLKYRASQIVIDKMAASGALLDAAEKAGLTILSPSVQEIGHAFGVFYQMTTDHKIAHRDQPGLRAALAGAALREFSDGAHAWARKDSAVDISPLCAATMAVWAANKFARPYDLLKSIA